MATIFNEDNTIEQMMLSTLQKNGWKYIPAEELPRMYSDVLVEPMVKEALIRLNPEIAEDPSRADEVIYKLRTLVLSVQPHNLVTQNEIFKKMIFEENSYPFGKDGRMVPIRFFGTMRKEDLALNEYVVTNQWIYPQAEGGKRLDIVLLINGFPIAIGELKTPVRSAITWLDAAGDISAYEKSIPAMFVTNVFNFATEGKCYRYGSINMPINMWGPWHTAIHKAEGSLADVKISVEDMISPKNVMDIFQFFTMFATDKKYRKYKIICRYQQFEGANMIVNRVIAGYPKKGLIWHFQGSGKSLELLKSKESFDDGILDGIISAFLAQCEKDNLYPWNYYYVKYPVFRPGSYGKMSNDDVVNKPYMFSVMQTKTQWSQNTYMPYLKEADDDHLSRDEMGQYLVYDDVYIVCENNSYGVYRNDDDSLTDTVTISQNEAGIDTEDRIIKLKKYIANMK